MCTGHNSNKTKKFDVFSFTCIPDCRRSCVQGLRLGENKGWGFFRVNFAFVDAKLLADLVSIGLIC